MSARWAASVAAVVGVVAIGATDVRSQAPRPSDKPTLYVTATAHLDSQWNWTVQDTIRQFVPSTFYTNFKNFEKYPDYTFTYEGAIHYMWFKEYHPADWPTLQKYVASGRWRLAGSWINAVDTNVPSPESLMRQALYGKRFFRQEFGKVSDDVYLPDCFGFGFALPSIARALRHVDVHDAEADVGLERADPVSRSAGGRAWTAARCSRSSIPAATARRCGRDISSDPEVDERLHAARRRQLRSATGSSARATWAARRTISPSSE